MKETLDIQRTNGDVLSEKMKVFVLNIFVFIFMYLNIFCFHILKLTYFIKYIFPQFVNKFY